MTRAYIEPAPKQPAPEVAQGGLSLASLTAAHRELCRLTTERAAEMHRRHVEAIQLARKEAECTRAR